MGVFKLGNSEINSISLVEPYESIEPDIIKPTYDRHLNRKRKCVEQKILDKKGDVRLISLN